MGRIGEYKVVQALWERCRGAGQKPAKLLGRSALRFAFVDASAQLLAEAAASAKAAGTTEEELRGFLEGFGRTVEEGPSAEADGDLVWATDVKQAVAARQRQRLAEAAARVQRASTAESFSEELRAALAGQGPHGESSVQVEELDG